MQLLSLMMITGRVVQETIKLFPGMTIPFIHSHQQCMSDLLYLHILASTRCVTIFYFSQSDWCGVYFSLGLLILSTTGMLDGVILWC